MKVKKEVKPSSPLILPTRSKEAVIHAPGMRSGSESFTKALQRFSTSLWRNKNLTYQLYKRDLLGNYRKSVLGLLWILLAPLIGAISWSFMNSAGILSPGDVGIPYPAYVLISGAIWAIFAGTAATTGETLETNKGFISQVYFPHEILFVKQAGSALSSATITFFLNMLVALVLGVVPSWYIVFYPLLVLPLVLLGSGIGFFVSVLSAIATDIRRVATLVIGMLMFATPVVYVKTPDNPWLSWFVEHNPLTILIRFPREVILFGTFDHSSQFALTSLGVLVFFIVSLRFFFTTEPSAIERMF